jgi:hypothetical protein
VELPKSLGFKIHRKLNKFATMGNAVTFPVESLVFLAISIAAILTERGERVTLGAIKALAGSVAVFGDDIIVPSDQSGAAVVEALESLGFKINVQKSFSEGNFRESCGVDAFRGQVVTPVYWRRLNDSKPESIAANIALHNNLQNRFLMQSARLVATTLPMRGIPWVDVDSGVLGFQTRCRPTTPVVRRWNNALQRVEVKVAMITSSQAKTSPVDDGGLLQYFTERPAPTTMWTAGAAQRPVVRKTTGWVHEALLYALQ